MHLQSMKVYKYPRELSIAVLVAARLFSAEKAPKTCYSPTLQQHTHRQTESTRVTKQNNFISSLCSWNSFIETFQKCGFLITVLNTDTKSLFGEHYIQNVVCTS